MRRIALGRQWLIRALRRDEDGISLVFVGITIVMLVGMVAFALDIGLLYAERRELQSGADAAVLAIAEDCGRGLTCTAGSAQATAEAYAVDNASDSAATLFNIDLDAFNRTISVTTNSELPGGARVVPPLFAQILGFPGTEVRAFASAAWGWPSAGTTLPLIISDCEWFVDPDVPNPVPHPPGTILTFTFHNGSDTDDCNAQAGQDFNLDDRLAGGFGWLAPDGSGCETYVEIGGDVSTWPYEDPGASPPGECDPSTMANLLNEPYVLIPWFNDVTGLGANGQYRVAGIGAVKVLGYNFGGQYKAPSAGSAPCTGDDRCIEVEILDMETITTGETGGENRGALIVKLTG